LIGKRIKYFRKRKNLTQKELGILLGFPENSAGIRIAQYESEDRIPKRDLVEKMAKALGVCAYALMDPDLNTNIGLIHARFFFEDYWKYNRAALENDIEFKRMVMECGYYGSLLRNGKITQEEYDDWRYNYTGLEEKRK